VATASMGWRLYLDLVKRSCVAWLEDRAPTMGAALAFYSAFSLAPLLVIVIAVAGAVFGVEAARGAIVGQIAGLVGAPAAEAIQALLKAAQERTTSIFAAVVGLVTMLVGATTILVELQDDLDHIWKAPKRQGSSLLSILRARILSLGMILGVGFLLLISLVVSGVIAAFEAYAQSHFPGATLPLLQLWNPVVSVGAITVLFAMLYKWLPNVPIAWKDVWMGAFITAILFSAGRFAIGLYLGRSAIASAYGAAGTLAVLLLWLYYSAQVFLLGAEFTCLYATHRARCRSRAYSVSPGSNE
jgi:membrane protein